MELALEHDQRREVFALVAELAARVVLDELDARPGGQLDQPASPLELEGHSRGVLEVREGIDELRPGPQCLLQEVGPHPCLVHRDTDVFRLIGIPGLEPPK